MFSFSFKAELCSLFFACYFDLLLVGDIDRTPLQRER